MSSAESTSRGKQRVWSRLVAGQADTVWIPERHHKKTLWPCCHSVASGSAHYTVAQNWIGVTTNVGQCVVGDFWRFSQKVAGSDPCTRCRSGVSTVMMLGFWTFWCCSVLLDALFVCLFVGFIFLFFRNCSCVGGFSSTTPCPQLQWSKVPLSPC